MKKHPELVEIEWRDSEMWKVGWDNISEVCDRYRKDGMSTMRSLGYIVDVSRHYILFAGDLQFDSNWQVSRGGRIMAIPRSCVKIIKRVIGIGGRRNRKHTGKRI